MVCRTTCSDASWCSVCSVQCSERLQQIGNIEKGALTSAGHFNSRNGRWFGQKKKATNVSVGENAGRIIQRDSLIKLHCKRGKCESVENYRVLA